MFGLDEQTSGAAYLLTYRNTFDTDPLYSSERARTVASTPEARSFLWALGSHAEAKEDTSSVSCILQDSMKRWQTVLDKSAKL